MTRSAPADLIVDPKVHQYPPREYKGHLLLVYYNEDHWWTIEDIDGDHIAKFPTLEDAEDYIDWITEAGAPTTDRPFNCPTCFLPSNTEGQCPSCLPNADVHQAGEAGSTESPCRAESNPKNTEKNI